MKDMGLGGGEGRFRSVKTDEFETPFKNVLPILGPGTVWHVDSTISSSGNGKTWAKAFKTIQEAVNASGDGTGDTIFVGPGTYAENVLIKDHSGLKIFGTGVAKDVRVRASTATTKYPFTPVGESALLGACFVVLDHDIEIANMFLDASGSYAGIYNGDGYRVDSAYDEDSEYGKFHDLFFKYGAWGIALDGCGGDQEIYNNYFCKQSDGGIHIGPGGTRTVQRIRIHHNYFAGCENYGVYLYNTNTTKNVWVGPDNVFADQLPGTTEMTYSVKFQGTGGNFMVGNFDATDIGAIGAATDLMSGNFEKHGMNSPVYVAET